MDINKAINAIDFEKFKKSEIETRFGKKVNGVFSPGITLRQYTTFHEKFKKSLCNKKVEYFLIATHLNNVRNKKILEPKEESPELCYPWLNGTEVGEEIIIKKRQETIDVEDYSLRVSVCEEIPANPEEVKSLFDTSINPVKYFKVAKRVTFEHKYYKIDLTMFKTATDINHFSEMKYDIEVEFLNKKEGIDSFIKIIKEISAIYQNSEILISNSEKTNVLKNYKRIVGKLKFAGLQPVTFRNELIVKDLEYSVTLKLDGKRSLIFINDSKIYLINSKMEVNLIRDELGELDTLNGTLIDSEIYNNKMYCFDILYHQNKNVSEYPLKEKLLLLEEILKELEYTIDVVVKKYFFGDFYKNCSKLVRKNFDSENTNENLDENMIYDGIIIVPSITIKKGCPQAPLKWKPEHLNTIDFKIKKENGTVVLLCDHDTPFTYKGKDFSIFKGSELDSYSNGNVVEFSYNIKESRFLPLKLREDKTKGNYIDVAVDNFDILVNPSFDFTTRKNVVSAGRFKHYIIRKEIEAFSKGIKYILELNCGSGDNIQKWIDYNIKNVTGIYTDIDDGKILEHRKHKMKESEYTRLYNFSFINCEKLNSEWSEKVTNSFQIATCFNGFEDQLNKKDLDLLHFNLSKCLVKKFIVVINETVGTGVTKLEKLMKDSGFDLVIKRNFTEYIDIWKSYCDTNVLSETEKLEISNMNVYHFNVNVSILPQQVEKWGDILPDNVPDIPENVPDETWLLKDLKEYCKRNNLAMTGTKAKILERISNTK